MIGTSATWPIPVRVAVAGCVGVVASVLVVLAEGAAAGRASSTGSVGRDALQLLAATLLFVQLGSILAGPLVIIAIVCGVLFRQLIARHLLAWSLAAPVVVWLFVCVMDALTRRNRYFATHDFLDRLAVTTLAGDNLLFLFGPFVSSVVFYILSASRNRRPA